MSLHHRQLEQLEQLGARGSPTLRVMNDRKPLELEHQHSPRNRSMKPVTNVTTSSPVND